MINRTVLSLGLSALVLAGVGGIASAGAPAADAAAKRATKALARRDASAVGYAEAAVAADRANVAYRMLLGQSYLQAGRFLSARDAFADVLTLQPGNGRAALNLTLSQIATGDWQAARQTLSANTAAIAPVDRGLAMALSGNPAGAVQLLMAVARQPGADAKVRQNLGLALALSGQWPLARAVAAADLSPADVDRRMTDWAAFAQPRTASDQVAALLGVQAAADGGRPVMLALNAAPSVVVAASAPTPIVAAPASIDTVPVAAPDAIPAVAAQMVAALPEVRTASVVFGPRREVVQPLPVPMIVARGPAKVAVGTPDGTASNRAAPIRLAAFRAAAAASRRRVSGEWVVQLGAFQNAAVARDAWGRISRRHAGFSGQQPRGVPFRSGGDDFYRLSVGGYDRASADGLCRRLRAGGGVCFVRRVAGDRLAQWGRPGRPTA